MAAALKVAEVASRPSACSLFPTELEEYYCLSCCVRCSGLALLVGPHTNHDYLPLSDALLYMPAALLRETREVVREAEEMFAKPWRVQDQQREATLYHLLELRRDRLAAMAQILADVRHVDARLLEVTEVKALDLANWRYQQKGLRRKLERLQRGAATLSACFTSPASSLAAAVDVAAEVTPRRRHGLPSWAHMQSVAHKELAQAEWLLQGQLTQLEEAEQTSKERLASWHCILDSVPWDSTQEYTSWLGEAGPEAGQRDTRAPTTPSAGTTTAAPTTPVMGESAQTPRSRLLFEGQVRSPHAANDDGEAAAGHPSRQSASLSPYAVPPPPHPSDAEVALLQHALRNVNGALRYRLLRAAAASLASSSTATATSSSSQSPPVNRGSVGGGSSGVGSYARYADASDDPVVAETPRNTVPLSSPTPLRFVPSRTDATHRGDDGLAPQPPSRVMGQSADFAPVLAPSCPSSVLQKTREAREDGRLPFVLSSPSQPTRPPAPSTAPTMAVASPTPDMVAPCEVPVALNATADELEQQRRRRESLLAREQELKDSLNQMLCSSGTTSSSSAWPSRERSSERGTW